MPVAARAWRRGALYGMGVIASVALLSAARAESLEELDDAAARMQYAFYTGDARALEEVVMLMERTEAGAGLAALKSYQLAYGHWRLAEVHAAAGAADRSRSGARTAAVRAAQACARHARAAVVADGRMAEAYAIHAVCDAFSPAVAEAGTQKRSCNARSLRTALSITSDNPRIGLIEAMCVNRTYDPEDLRSVVAAFEAAPPRTAGEPDWGHAEVLAMLGNAYLMRGEPVAARDALERALVIAPDYRRAQELLQTAATRPR